MIRKGLRAAGVLATFLLFGCAAWRGVSATQHELAPQAKAAGEAGSEILAEGRGVTITAADLDRRIELMRPMGRRRFSSRGARRRLVEMMAETRLLYEECVKEGLDKDPELLERLEIFRRNQAVANLRKRMLAKITVSDEELRKAYKERRARYTVPRKVRIRQIVLPGPKTPGKGDDGTVKAAREILKKAQKGSDFASLAKRYSIDKESASRGGDVGFANRRRLPGPAYEAAMALEKKGQVSGLVIMPGEIRILQAEEIVPEKVKPFDEVKPWLKRSLLNEKKRKAWSEYVERLKKEAGLTVYKEKITAPEKAKRGAGRKTEK